MGLLINTVLVFFLSVASYVLITYYTKLDFGKDIYLHGECARIEMPGAPEDFVVYGEQLITGTCDWGPLFF
jgi:hypothetical protein